MTRTSTRLLAASGAVVLTALAASPATAAAVTSRADANAATVSIAGNGQGTGTVEATYDGQESVTGETAPPAAPFSQQFVDLGVLTQQATAGNGTSAACAGVAGSGGGVVQIGDGSCLTPGDTVNGSLSDIDLGALGLEAPTDLPLPTEAWRTPSTDLGGGRDELDGAHHRGARPGRRGSRDPWAWRCASTRSRAAAGSTTAPPAARPASPTPPWC